MILLSTLPFDLKIDLAKAVVEYMRQKKYLVDTLPGQLNTVYIEGMDLDGKPNKDLLDGWNDLRLVITHLENGLPQLKMAHVATTEPGRSATFSAAASRRGGVARIAFGQYRAWQMGYHNQSKNGKNHPALVQRAPLSVHRDRNRDGIRRATTCILACSASISTRRDRGTVAIGLATFQKGAWWAGCGSNTWKNSSRCCGRSRAS